MKKHLLSVSFVLLAAAALASTAFAAKFANPFTEFELPPQWGCNLEGAEWVCQSSNDSKKGEAVMIVLAKMKGSDDSIESYMTYLKSAKSYNGPGGKPAKSEALYAKSINVNDQQWVDAAHKDSELPGFNTRYLATVKQDIGVLISFSVAKDKYQSYLPMMDDLVKSLKVFRKQNAAPGPVGPNLFDQSRVPSLPADTTVFPVGQGAQIAGGGEGKKAPSAPKDSGMGLILLAGAAAVGFLIWKKKRSAD